MADELLSELDEQLNPKDNDFVGESNYTGVADPVTGSLYQSLKIKLITIFTFFKNKLLASGNCLTITTLTFTAADYMTYEPIQYEMVLFVNARFGTATTIKIGTLNDPEAYQIATTNPSCNPNIYANSSNVSDRSINIALNGTGTITIISIKNV